MIFDLGLQRNSTLRVGNLDTKRLGLGNNLNSVLGRDVVGNLGSVGLGDHQQNIQVGDVLDEVDLETGRVQELGLLVRTVTDVGLLDSASESSSDTRVNTLLLSPVLRDSVVSVRVVSLELLGVLLDNLWVRDRGSHWMLVSVSRITWPVFHDGRCDRGMMDLAMRLFRRYILVIVCLKDEEPTELVFKIFHGCQSASAWLQENRPEPPRAMPLVFTRDDVGVSCAGITEGTLAKRGRA